tara:strand:- start:4003 stop:4149 length:147 start_codon:yes stop_codon:yes gene_type:complete
MINFEKTNKRKKEAFSICIKNCNYSYANLYKLIKLELLIAIFVKRDVA